MSTEPETYTVVNYVVEFRRPEATQWLTWPADYGTDEAPARRCYQDLIASKRARGGRLLHRIVRRTAIITDEVILEEQPEEPEEP